jgi:ATP-dependent Zn protease
MDHYYLQLFLDWVPFLIFIGLLIYFMKKGIGGKQAAYMDFMKEYCMNHLEETREINTNLSRIADALDQSKAQ